VGFVAGRPRSDEARQAILSAALAELGERGYAGVTVEGIAARAGVGKQTIYRWWPSKAEVVLEAARVEASARIKVPDRGSLGADLRAFLTATFRQRDQQPVVVGLMAQALLDAEFAEKFREQFLFRRRAALRAVFDRGRERGELPAGVDVELLIDVVFGVLWYRLLIGHAPLTPRAARQLAEVVERAVDGYRRAQTTSR
jgi:AcrR family transcriptional regulator